MDPTTAERWSYDWSHWWTQIRETCCHLLFAPSCALCRAPRPASTYPHLCHDCEAMLPHLEPPYCHTCGEWFVGAIYDDFRCGYCADLKFSFEFAIAAWRAIDTGRELIHHFKYHQATWLAPTLATALHRCLRGPRADPRLATITDGVLVPVPLHTRRFRERTFNQAEELCHELTKLTGFPTYPLLRRLRYTTAQAQLTRDERWHNLNDAFAIDDKHTPPLTGKSILLIDDVFTTGATMEACASVLKKHLPTTKIVALTVARG